MTSLLIAYPDIPFNATVITTSSAASEDQNVFNLVSGDRARSFKFAATSTSRTITFDLGPDYASGQATVNYMAIARADRLQANGPVTRIQLASSSDDASYTDRIDATSFDSATLYGPRGDDYFTTIATTSAFRYWRVSFTATGATDYWFSKLYFGSYFDWGKDPAEVKIEDVPASTEMFISDAGAQRGERMDQPKYRFTFTWKGVTDAKVTEFQTKIGSIAHREMGVFLYSATEHQVLDGQRIMHCKLVSAESRKNWYGWNEVRAVFEEMIG